MKTSERPGRSRHRSPHLAIVAAHATTMGGMERFSKFVCETMLEAGWQVTVALSGENVYGPIKTEACRLLQVDRVDWLDDTYAGDRHYRWPVVLERRAWFSRVQPQAALFIQSSNTPFRCAVAGAFLAGVPVVTTHRTMPWPLPDIPRSRHFFRLLPGIGLHDRLMRRKTWLTGALASAIVYNSEAVRRGYESVYGYPTRRGVVIPNAVDVTTQETVRHARGNDGSEVVIGYVGRLSREKRIDVLLRAVARLRSERCIRVVIYGDGPDREDLMRLRSELGLTSCVEFAGATQEPEAVYPGMDIVVLCSPRESSSNMILEAMAHGGAVVVTDTGGMPELVQDGRCGVVVPPLDVSALTDALRHLVDDEVARSALGRAAIRQVEVIHSPERIARMWTDLFDRVGGRRRCQPAPKSMEESIAAFAVHRV